MKRNLTDLPGLQKYQSYALLVLRLTFGIHLLIYTADNVFSYNRMLVFRDFLKALQVPFPLFAAFLSVYVQFTCGLLLIIGFKVRLAGLFIFINFIFAILIAHRGQTYEQYFPAAQLIAIGLFFMLYGAGPFSLDDWQGKPAKRLILKE